MKAIKWFFLLMLVFSTIGCASVEPRLFQNSLAGNPNVSPDQLQETLKSYPIIYNQVGSISYQVYKVGFFNNLNAVYFKDGQFVTKAPYDKYTNLKMLLQLGAISQDDYNKGNAQFLPENTFVPYENESQQGQSLMDWTEQNMKAQQEHDDEQQKEQQQEQFQQQQEQERQQLITAARQTTQ